MKRVIITGTKGYIANRLKIWLNKSNRKMEVILLDMRDNIWKSFDFKANDVIVHAAALVHRNEKKISYAEYERVNVKLTAELANRAKKAGCNQFIFISTAAVYGIKPSCIKTSIITNKTVPVPRTKYEVSKFEAEKALLSLEDENFKVAIVRAPFVYGPNCPGNYKSLRKLTLKFKISPRLENKKSIIYVDNLCEFLYIIIRDKMSGIFMPQNKHIMSTYEMAQAIAECNNQAILISRIFNPLVCLASLFITKIAVAFSNEYYSESISNFDIDYNIVDFKQSIKLSELK